jgi:hypothetical protein
VKHPVCVCVCFALVNNRWLDFNKRDRFRQLRNGICSLSSIPPPIFPLTRWITRRLTSVNVMGFSCCGNESFQVAVSYNVWVLMYIHANHLEESSVSNFKVAVFLFYHELIDCRISPKLVPTGLHFVTSP